MHMFRHKVVVSILRGVPVELFVTGTGIFGKSFAGTGIFHAVLLNSAPTTPTSTTVSMVLIKLRTTGVSPGAGCIDAR